MTSRMPLDQHTDDTLDQLYREIDTLRAVCQSNKQAYVGAVKAAMEADKRAKQAEADRDRYQSCWNSARDRAQALGAGVILRVADRDFWKQLAQEAREAETRRTTERDEQQTRAQQAEATLNAIRALHERDPEADYCVVCSNHGDITWPCATVAVLDQHGQTPL